MSKVSNILTMLQLLNMGKRYSIKELADELEVSPRMIRIYKEELDKAGIYIDTIKGPYGGYVLNQSIRLPLRKFKANDYELLNKYILEEKDDEVKEKLILLQDKIKGIYIGSHSEAKELKLEGETLNKYNCLVRAIRERKKIRIVYYSYGKGVNERVICPIEVFLFQDGWYCSAYCELRKDIRHFELRRISEYTLLNENY